MKAETLRRLSRAGFPVPPFITLERGQTADLSFSRADLFAVRSSFGGEDGSQRSYAGQFLTRLNIPRREVDQAAKQVWDSAAAPDPYTGDSGGRGGCVIVQEMAAADLSGVVFTANPLGPLNEMVITVGRGLGSGAVEDRTAVSTCYYNVDDGLYETEGPPEAPRLTDEQLRAVTALALRAEALLGEKLDMEFAFAGETLFLLQARSITTLPEGPLRILDNSNLAESYPGVCLPLTESFVRELYSRIFRRCVRRLSGSDALTEQLDETLAEMVTALDGHLYYRLDNWYRLLQLLPFEKRLIPVWQRMLGIRCTAVAARGVRVTPGQKAAIVLRFTLSFFRCPTEMDRLGAFFGTALTQGRRRLSGCDSPAACLALLEDLKEEFLSRWDVTLINDLYAFVFTALAGRRGDLGAVEHLASMEPVTALSALGEVFRREGASSPVFRRRFQAYIDRFGDRCPGELKLESRTFRTDPALLEDYLSTYRPTPAPAADEAPRGGWLLRRARAGITRREQSRLHRSALFGLAREIYLKIGRQLTEAGRLDAPRDIFLLFHQELTEETANLRSLAAARREEYAALKTLPVHTRLIFAGEILPRRRTAAVSGALAENTLRGQGVSQGVAEGEVLVLHGPPEAGADAEGKIIAAAMTDPGWAFFLASCRGLIAQQGSLLSHSAIISRELRKPAVVNVPGLLSSVRAGDYVRINGLTGEITILKKRSDPAVRDERERGKS